MIEFYDFYKPESADSEDWQLMIISRNAKVTTGFLILLSIEFRSNYTGGLIRISLKLCIYSKTVIKTYLINKLIIDSGSAHLGVGEGHVVKFSFSEKVTKICAIRLRDCP